MKVTVGVCGGIAAYKAVELVRLLQGAGLDPHVVMTRAAGEFVRPLTFAAISGHKVITGLWEGEGGEANVASAIDHIEEARTTQALIVAPATADVLARFAQGLADDFLTTLYLATKAKVIVAPAMNVNMWEHAATRENLRVLRERGVMVVEPGAGYLACGMVGSGRLAEPAEIVRVVVTELGGGERGANAGISPLRRQSAPPSVEMTGLAGDGKGGDFVGAASVEMTGFGRSGIGRDFGGAASVEMTGLGGGGNGMDFAGDASVEMTGSGGNGNGRDFAGAAPVEMTGFGGDGIGRGFAGETVLLTAGGTREPIDPVRYIGNRSSGKMGYALAAAAVRRGARVVLVSAAKGITTPVGCELVAVTTAAEMHAAVLARLPEATVVIAAAAVSDYRVKEVAAQKLKRDGARTLELTPTEDIVQDVVTKRNPGTLVIGFAAETEDVLANGRAKLERKGVDAIFVNDVSSGETGFDSDWNAGTLLTRGGGAVEMPVGRKTEMAERILDRVAELRVLALREAALRVAEA